MHTLTPLGLDVTFLVLSLLFVLFLASFQACLNFHSSIFGHTLSLYDALRLLSWSLRHPLDTFTWAFLSTAHFTLLTLFSYLSFYLSSYLLLLFFVQLGQQYISDLTKMVTRAATQIEGAMATDLCSLLGLAYAISNGPLYGLGGEDDADTAQSANGRVPIDANTIEHNMYAPFHTFLNASGDIDLIRVCMCTNVIRCTDM